MDQAPRPHVYLDDGHPESNDYASNYAPVPTAEPRHWLSVLFRLRAARDIEAAAAADDPATAQHPADSNDPEQRRRA